jgi:hypothetical protein
MSSDTIEKAGGTVGIVGTGHRARVCSLSFPFFSFTSHLIASSLHFLRYYLPPMLVIQLARKSSYDAIANIQLYTTAISARPSSQLVALCDLNSERMKHHNDLLKELGQPEAATYHAVSSPPFSTASA